MSTSNGYPWQQQYAFNTSQSGAITGWEETAIANPYPISEQAQSIVLYGFVFVFSNTSSTCYRTTISESGILGGTWTTVSTGISSSYDSGEFVLVGDKLYYIGGANDTSGHRESSTVVWYATIATNGSIGSWTTAAVLPEGRSAGRIIIVSGRMYYIGGKQIRYIVPYTTFVEDSKASVFYADINSLGVTGSWSTSSNSLPTARHDFCLAFADEKIYVIGGAEGSNKRYITYEAAVSEAVIGSWSNAEFEDTNLARSNAAVAVSNNIIYIIGGQEGSTSPSNYVNRISLASNGSFIYPGWLYSTFLDYPVAITHATSVITSSKIYLLGGVDRYGYASHAFAAPFNGGLNDYADFILAYGTGDQEEPLVGATGSAHLGGSGVIDQIVAEASGTADTIEIPIGDGIVDQPESEVSGLASTIEAAVCEGNVEQLEPGVVATSGDYVVLGNSEQMEPLSAGTAETHLVGLGNTLKYLTRVSGLAYTGDYISDSIVDQQIPLAEGSAFTWNVGLGVSDQPVSIITGEATSPYNLIADGESFQIISEVSGIAQTSAGVRGSVTQPIKVVSGKAYSISIGIGNVIQPIHKVTGKVLSSPSRETLLFARCTDSEAPITAAAEYSAIFFNQCISGITPTILASNYYPLNFSHGAIEGRVSIEQLKPTSAGTAV